METLGESSGLSWDWRSLLGLSEAKADLSRLVDSGRMHPVILLEGLHGIGKRHLSIWLTARLVCKSTDSVLKPCACCEACRSVMFGRHPDVAVLDSGGDSIKTSDIGMLQEHFSMMSGEGLRIGIIMNADRMTIEAANRALKTLEEPSSQVRVILTSSRPLLLPATILGRCLRWRVRPPTRDEVLPWFKHLLQQRGRSMPADDVLDQWAMRLRFSPGLLKKEVEDDTDHVFGVQQEIRQLLNASEPSGVVRAAANLARQSKAKVPEIIEALEWELNCKWRQLLAHGVAPLDQVKRVAINADRRRMIANIRKQAIMGKVTLNAQLVAESVGLVSWGGSDK